MTILAVDDEQLLLIALENAIREAVPDVNVISYRKAADALPCLFIHLHELVEVHELDSPLPSHDSQLVQVVALAAELQQHFFIGAAEHIDLLMHCRPA